MKKFIVPIFLIALVLLASCAPQNPAPVTIKDSTSDSPTKEKEVTPQVEDKGTVDEVKSVVSIPEDIRTLLKKSDQAIANIEYHYKGPEDETSYYEFFIKGSKIKYLPPREIKFLDKEESFDSIFLDTGAKTAAQYCNVLACKFRGKKAELDYDGAYIWTMKDWVNKITSAEKVSEEVIERRSTMKIKTNFGFAWIDKFYGMPVRVESDGKVYRFDSIATGKVTDEDVTPLK